MVFKCRPSVARLQGIYTAIRLCENSDVLVKFDVCSTVCSLMCFSLVVYLLLLTYLCYFTGVRS